MNPRVIVPILIRAMLVVLISAITTAGFAGDSLLPRQGSYTVMFPWHFRGHADPISDTEIFSRGYAWGPTINDGKQGFLHNASAMSIYTIQTGKDGFAKLSGQMI